MTSAAAVPYLNGDVMSVIMTFRRDIMLKEHRKFVKDLVAENDMRRKDNFNRAAHYRAQRFHADRIIKTDDELIDTLRSGVWVVKGVGLKMKERLYTHFNRLIDAALYKERRAAYYVKIGEADLTIDDTDMRP